MKFLPVNQLMNRTSQRNRVVNARRGLEVGMLSLAAVLAMVPVGVRGAGCGCGVGQWQYGQSLGDAIELGW
jgi:hypothetical protein